MVMEKMMELKLEHMAEAHLQTVEKAISDLEQQAQSIYKEIKNLQEYLEKGKEVVKASKT